jgi:hypothetical protein
LIQQASVEQVRKRQLSRKNTHIVITMCFYPRGLRKEYRDEYRSDLAPDRTLFRKWKIYEQSKGHDNAFRLSKYEQHFHLSETALSALQQYAIESHKKDIYFVCKCQIGERCHREMLMLAAQKKFGADIAKVFNKYPQFEKRLADLKV